MRSFVSIGVLVFVMLFLSVNCRKDGSNRVAAVPVLSHSQETGGQFGEGYIQKAARATKPATITFPSVFDILKHLR